jgi:uncharacterized protein
LGRRSLEGLISVAVVLHDFYLVSQGELYYTARRAIPPAVAWALLLLLARGDPTSIGRRLRPVQGLRYWVMATVKIGAAIGGLIVAGGTILVLAGRIPRLYATGPDRLWPVFIHMCLFAPVVEELIYRLVLCAGAEPLLGPWPTIAVSGLVFGALHVLYGNPDPANLVAGFFLTWAYLKSRSILVPVVLHALGNVCALTAQLGCWYWLTRP